MRYVLMTVVVDQIQFFFRSFRTLSFLLVAIFRTYRDFCTASVKMKQNNEKGD